MRMVYLRPGQEELLLRQAKRPRDRCLMKLMLATGMRVSEVEKLRVQDIDFSTREILIWGGKGGKDRVIFVDHDTLKELRHYIGTRMEGPVFPSRQGGPNQGLSHQSIQRIVKDMAKAAGLPKISCHKLRHTFAIRWVQKQGDIESLRRILGHTSLSTTQVYLDFDNEHVRAEYDRLSMIKPRRPRDLRSQSPYIA